MTAELATLSPETLLSTLGIGLILFLIILAIGIYIFIALAIQTIAKKQKYKYPWFAWIPLLNLILIFQLGGFHWEWIFLYLGTLITEIKILAIISTIAIIVLTIISFWKIFEKEKYPGALSFLLIVPIARLIVLGMIAWKKPKEQSPTKKVSKKKTTLKKKK
ncbi:MAG: hypothetical protein U9Q99_03005 [Nanoarchaeota archaeon]|nr:hypothetical protein [Nanoarchaeota archaeon]